MADRSPMPDVVVVLPGILGSVLTKNDKTVWGFSGKLLGTVLLTRGGTLRKELSLQDDSPDHESLEDGIVAEKLIADLHMLPSWKIDGYSKLCTYIKQRFDVVDGLNFFEFPYDWRRDNRVSAKKLARLSHEWLKKWRERSNSDAKLILIAHSMGGLVSRYFLEVLGGWKDTRALFSFGTPYRGSLNALDALANGIRKGPFGLIDLSEMARSFTSLYQLLPIYKVYDAGDGNLVRIGETSGVPNLDAEKARAALEFHNEIRNAATENRKNPQWAEEGYQIYPIVGIEQETKQLGRKVSNRVELSVTYNGKILGGDGTVPRVSALPVEFDDVQPQPGRMFAATQHASLQNADATLVQLAGQIDDLYLDFGGFKSLRPVGTNVSLQIDDLVTSDEKIQVRAKSDAPIVLRGDLLDAYTNRPLQQLTLKEGTDGWQHAAFEPAASGYYRVRVTGEGVNQPAEDAISVADAAQVEREG
ncbi:MAG TPA: hypothetical protein VFS76_00035 [Pyrinomonadaceae bacterium]|nr:hypothetical protein [Pyrinomonadaceae bacterium]